MDGAARQSDVAGQRGNMVLVGQFGLQERCLGGLHVGQHHRYRLVPPRQGAQIVLAQRETASRQVHVRQGGAHLRAVRGAGGQLTLAGQHAHDRRGFATQGMHHFALGVGCGVGDGNALGRQMRHQAQVIRKLLVRQALKQGQHIAGALGVGKVVGIFDAAAAAFQGGEAFQAQAFEQGAGLVE